MGTTRICSHYVPFRARVKTPKPGYRLSAPLCPNDGCRAVGRYLSGLSSIWTISSEKALGAHLEQISGLPHQPFFAVIPLSSGHAEGWASFCDIANMGIIRRAALGGKVLRPAARPAPKAVPVPKNWKPPSHSPQPPPTSIPAGWRVRHMPPNSLPGMQNGYWRLEKPLANGGWQGVNPSTMKPGPQWETHIPLS